MADPNEIDDDIVVGKAAAASPGVGKLLVVSLLVSLLMSAGVGAGVYFLLKTEDGDTAEVVAGEDSVKEEKAKGPPIYHKMAEPFIVNLSTPGTRFLQVTVELMTRNTDVVNAVEKHDPLIRNNLLMLLSSQSPESIATVEGKESLRQEALAEIRRVLKNLAEPAGVEDLYFTSLVVQ
ncbi:flagellar basal body protein FliL [Kineobactrum sediminis]|uniref:Flagellar protein FliL n=1 Tax=Kineobactrum sediminis TaxID=1905677 RepID=A0A2N5Y6H2_9GAMM|nr:flagellar basal body-associated FliL family protein [Kineobactrum sediminis]PLW83969.1 flagellar basal body protein FliL [Kineobactrum sediminis]